MKKMYLIAALFAFVWVACKNRNEITVKDGKVSLPDAVSAVKKLTDETQKAKGRWEERKAKGDTISMSYQDLQGYLPDVSGYTKDGGPKGSSMSMPGYGSFSEAEQRYENGDKKIRVKISDWNSSQTGFLGMTAVYRMGISSEDDNKKQGPADLGMANVAGYETVYKQRKDAELVLVAGDRFVVDLHLDGSNDIEELRSVAKSICSGLSSKY